MGVTLNASLLLKTYRQITQSNICPRVILRNISLQIIFPTASVSLCRHLSPAVVFQCREFSSQKGKYPPLDESELSEKFTRGGGPGGQAVATTNNCVLLKHMPTGITIKCHAERSLELNRKIARRRLQEKLDFHLNGENSIISQEKIRAKEKLLKRKAKTKMKLERIAAEKAAAAEAVSDTLERGNDDNREELIISSEDELLASKDSESDGLSPSQTEAHKKQTTDGNTNR